MIDDSTRHHVHLAMFGFREGWAWRGLARAPRRAPFVPERFSCARRPRRSSARAGEAAQMKNSREGSSLSDPAPTVALDHDDGAPLQGLACQLAWTATRARGARRAAACRALQVSVLVAAVPLRCGGVAGFDPCRVALLRLGLAPSAFAAQLFSIKYFEVRAAPYAHRASRRRAPVCLRVARAFHTTLQLLRSSARTLVCASGSAVHRTLLARLHQLPARTSRSAL